ncbi:MAG TPA: alkaline phosphatase family protein [Vicinamibacteria bacterium]|nr:alkaline phosphatase family protein [Vicinamibacteria bacterium]
MTPLAFALSLLVAAGPSARPASALSAPRPRLVVVVVVDQMRADYIDRYGHRWTGGLRRLLDQGAVFPQAAFPYLTTLTCVGHATVATGTLPRTHGIPANQWWDRDSGKSVTCTEDPAAPLVPYGTGSPSGGESALRLRVATFADELRAQAGTPPRVVTLSLKPRSAIMLAGHRGDAVLWSVNAQTWASSTAFSPTASPAVAELVKDRLPEAALGRVWNRLLAPDAYLFDDDAAGERPPAGWTRTFPHPLRGENGEPDAGFYTRWTDSPYADEALGAMAGAAVAKLGLGRGPGTDYLGVSFSTLDLVGHAFGPRSHEVQDILLRLDATLGRLLAELDRLVGREHYLLALTADHGVAPVPEQVALAGIDAGRIDTAEVRARIEKALAAWLGPGPHLAWAPYTEVYFAPGVMEKLRQMPEALRAAVEAAGSAPGVGRVLVGAELAQGSAADDPLALVAARSYVPGRSGDLVLLPKAYWIPTSSGTTHGTLYQYDSRVPLLLAGPGIKAGSYLGPATPADIAPTLAYLTGITLARTDGRVLSEALRPPAAAAKPAPGR